MSQYEKIQKMGKWKAARILLVWVALIFVVVFLLGIVASAIANTFMLGFNFFGAWG